MAGQKQFSLYISSFKDYGNKSQMKENLPQLGFDLNF